MPVSKSKTPMTTANGNRIEQTFASLRQVGDACLLPYLTAGYPDIDSTVALLRRTAQAGAPIMEVGIPFSDSIADGPVIQASFWEALARGFRVGPFLNRIAETRESIDAALIAMVSYTLVFRYGTDRFFDELRNSGFDGVILPDVPVEETQPIADSINRVGLSFVGLIAPTTSNERRAEIARVSSGFVYKIARAGITGERTALAEGLRREVDALRALTDLPVCVGFGISTPAQVGEVCEFAEGASVGSAIVRRMMAAVSDGADQASLVSQVGSFVDELVAGARRPSS